MANIPCPVEGCQYSTGDSTEAVAIALLNAHVAGTHSNNARPVAAQQMMQPRRTPKIDRPPLKDNISEETWNAFLQSWNIFVQGNGVDAADQAVQLYSCCDMPLKAKLTAVNQNILIEPVQNILALLKNLTVTPVAKTVKRNELLQMHQDASENIRTFLSRVKGKAITCDLQKECTWPHAAGPNGVPAPAHVHVNFTDEWIRHVILNGLCDDEIKRDILARII